MNLSNLSREEFERTIGYITSLCGYPAVSADKMNVLIDFLRVNHGYNTADELTDAYRALASARLEEKVDSFKSMTGMSASRVLQAYMRIRRKTDTAIPGNEKGFLTDETRELIFKYNGRSIMYQDELTQDEHKMLMRHWIEQNRLDYLVHKRADLLTASSFNFLEKEGTIRVKDGLYQKFADNRYKTICEWRAVEDKGKGMKVSEDNMMSKNRTDNFRKMMSPSAGGSVKDAIKRMAVAIYYDSIN